MATALSEFGHIINAGGGSSQVAEMPVYTTVPLGTIVQYIGVTDATYTNGYFYIRGESGWEQKNVQNGGGSGESGVIPVDPSDTSNINIWIETT